MPRPTHRVPAPSLNPSLNVQTVNNLWDETEAAAYLSVSNRCLQQWRQVGKGPRFRKLGPLVRYRPEDVIAYAEEDVRASTRQRVPA